MKKIILILFLLNSGVVFASPELSVPSEPRLASLLQKSLKAYASLNDYQAIFHKKEISKDVLGPEEKIYLKFEKPFKIYMGWLNTYKKGLQVVYERGKHRGKLAIHKPGLALGFLPVIFLDQNSPWVKEGSESYNIEDVGIGTFLSDFTDAVLRGEKEKKLSVQFSNETLTGELVDVTFKDTDKNSGFFAYHVKVLFDPVSKLPTEMQLFDWSNQPMGIYSYRDLKVNVGRAEEKEFKSQIDRQLYKVYKSA